MNRITFGSDPELHLLDRRDGKVVSSLRVLKRDKHNPIDLGDGIRTYADNVLIESSFPPETSTEGVVIRMRDVFSRMLEYLGPKYRLLPIAAAEYRKKEMRNKKVWESGCNPNFDVYMQTENPPADFTDHWRTGSFHLHVGHPMLAGRDLSKKEPFIKLMDIMVGCPSVIFDKDPTAAKRRTLYGKAGEYRPTPYGVEYRVLGNWCLRSQLLTKLVWDLVSYAVVIHEAGDTQEVLEAVGSNRVQHAINNNDPMMASEVIGIVGMPLPLVQRISESLEIPSFQEAWSL